MPNLRMDHELMADCARRLKEQGEAFESAIGQMDNIIGELEANWEGAAGNQYIEQYTNYKPDLIRTKDNINALGAQVQSASDIMREADDRIAQQISG